MSFLDFLEMNHLLSFTDNQVMPVQVSKVYLVDDKPMINDLEATITYEETPPEAKTQVKNVAGLKNG
jgi:hypothetical protein